VEEKPVSPLHLTDITSSRAALRRRFSLLDLNLRQVALAFLSPDEFATWSATAVNREPPLTPRHQGPNRTFASPRSQERRHTHLQSTHRSVATVDKLSVPCRLPYFLGQDLIAQGLDSLSMNSRRSRGSRILHRLSTLSPRGKDKPLDLRGSGATGEMVVAVLRELLNDRHELDKGWALRSVVGRDRLESQLAVFTARIKAVGALLEQFLPDAREAWDLREKLLKLVAWDADLCAAVLPWVDEHKPRDICLHAIDIADLLRSPLTDATVLQAIECGLDANEAVACHDAQWPLATVRLPRALNDRRLLGKPDYAWAAGGMASVHRLTYVDGAEEIVMVWKPEDASSGSTASDVIGITCNPERGGAPPHFGGRSMATYRVAKRLGLDLVPRTEWAVHCGRLGSAMALAKGLAPSNKGTLLVCLDPETAVALANLVGGLERLAKKFGFQEVTWSESSKSTLEFSHFATDLVFDSRGDPVLDEAGAAKQVRRWLAVWVWQDFCHPALRRDLTRLQWLDHLTGQVDRNAMNYLVAPCEARGVRLSAIDNDLSFPAEAKVPEPSSINGIWLPAMPEVVDEALATALLDLTEEAWGECLHGLMMPNEFQLACARLQAVQARIRELASRERIVSASDETWASPSLSAWLGLTGIDERLRAAADDYQLEQLWLLACRHSYLQRDATKQAMVLAGREGCPLFDPAAIQAFIRDELLKG